VKAPVNIALILIAFSLFAKEASAQKRYNVWAFGKRGGINFNTDPPTGWRSRTEAKEDHLPYYITSICDRGGNLMMYTDGITVWNRDGFKLPKFNNWWPLADKVMPLLVPRPGHDTLFYLFAISNAANPFQLQAFPLRLKNSGDIDEIVYPRPTGANTFQHRLVNNASMVLAGTSHCNQKDYWITTYAEHSLYSYLVTENGVNMVPVITNVPSTVINDSTIDPGYSNIKFSANSEKIVIPVAKENKVVIYDFDNATGQYNTPLEIHVDPAYIIEEVELSADGSKLYIAYKWFDPEFVNPSLGHDVAQVDLAAGSISQIEQSFTRITPISDRDFCSRASCFTTYRSLQLGPDGNIYVGMRYATLDIILVDQTMSVIEDPNAPGLNCRYRKSQFNIGVKYMFGGYNYIRSESFSLEQNGIQVEKQNCVDKPVKFSLLFNKVDSVNWEFGDAASGSNYSRSLIPQHTYPGPGSYTVKAIVYNKCFSDTAISVITINPDNAVKVPEQIKDTSVCVGNQLVLNARNGTSNAYTWENGLIYADRTIAEAGHYQVTVMNDCSIDHKEFEVRFNNCLCEVFIPTAFSPNNDGLNDSFQPITRCYVKQYIFRVFNRFGQVVFTSADPKQSWNGFMGPYPQAPGVYIWTLQYIDPNTKKTISDKGTVTLFR
jgi:gliding motility-associated-like protein